MGTGARDLGDPTHWTFEEWLKLPDDGYRYEIIDGVLVREPPAKPVHGTVATQLSGRLFSLLSPDEQQGLSWSQVGIRLADDRVLIPDFFYIRPDRRSIIGEDVIEGVPDMVCEVLSPSNRHHDLVNKRELYAQHGVPEYWIADPGDRTVTVLSDPVGGAYQSVQRFTEHDPLQSPVHGWCINLARVFPTY